MFTAFHSTGEKTHLLHVHNEKVSLSTHTSTEHPLPRGADVPEISQLPRTRDHPVSAQPHKQHLAKPQHQRFAGSEQHRSFEVQSMGLAEPLIRRITASPMAKHSTRQKTHVKSSTIHLLESKRDVWLNDFKGWIQQQASQAQEQPQAHSTPRGAEPRQGKCQGPTCGAVAEEQPQAVTTGRAKKWPPGMCNPSPSCPAWSPTAGVYTGVLPRRTW